VGTPAGIGNLARPTLITEYSPERVEPIERNARFQAATPAAVIRNGTASGCRGNISAAERSI